MQFKKATKMFTLPSLTTLSSSSGGLQCGLHATQVHPFQLFVNNLPGFIARMRSLQAQPHPVY